MLRKLAHQSWNARMCSTIPRVGERRAIGYIRVSSVGGRAGPGYHTLGIQQASIERTATFRRYELIDTLTDEDKTGRNRKRPGFAHAMERILAGEADAIIVWKVSRFSRNWREAAEDVETLLDADKDLLSEEGFDTATAGGRLLLRILFSLANWESDVLGEHWEVMKSKVVRDRGSHLGPSPLGYVSGDGGVLVPDPDTRDLVVELFKQRAGGASWSTIADMIDAVMPRASGWRRDRRTVERIISNRVYLGEVSWRDEVKRRAHVALVDPELFARANAAIVVDEPRRPKHPRTREYPLSGWLRCSGCGGPMGGSNVRTNPEKPRAYYVCTRRLHGCPHKMGIMASAAEEWAMSEAAKLHDKLRLVVDQGDDSAVTAALRDLEDIEQALHDMASVEVRRDLGPDWLPMVRRLRKQKVEIEQRLVAARRARGTSAIATGVAWADVPEADRWAVLRRMAPLGALVGPAVRGQKPADRLGLIPDVLDAEPDAIPK